MKRIEFRICIFIESLVFDENSPSTRVLSIDASHTIVIALNSSVTLVMVTIITGYYRCDACTRRLREQLE